MSDIIELTHEDLLDGLLGLARAAISHYAISPDATVRLINLSENATYAVRDAAQGKQWALRVHREGYHSRMAIASELAWQQALKADGAAATPWPVPGRDGELIQVVSYAHPALSRARNVVLFEWEGGSEPAANDVAGFELLGETAARMHAHVRGWERPEWFERLTWDFDTTLGSRPHWGRWQDGMGLTPDIEQVFAKTVFTIEQRLRRFGKSPKRFGLIHCDMRLANLLVDGQKVKVIDFDDSGFSWFLYDCATTVSFFEHEAAVPELVAAWVRGYRRVGELSAEEEAEIPTFVMLRRLLLVAWIGSHSETELAQAMGEQYTRDTVALCERYLAHAAGS
ncbi:MAG: phosphotransferase enzyme family protein [Hyphomicrobium sp.]|uniref:phosphotransferase enzyme family protein n=1 Tax=Hyphomicrobium sp. TaxID=82 RepID=UPI003D0FBF1B